MPFLVPFHRRWLSGQRLDGQEAREFPFENRHWRGVHQESIYISNNLTLSNLLNIFSMRVQEKSSLLTGMHRVCW